MADWTLLPKELVDLISKRLSTSYDVLRFRSVCSAWRSSVVAPKRRPLPPRFPVHPDDGVSDTSFGFYVSKSIVVLLGSPSLPLWLIKIEDLPNDKVHLLNPLSRDPFHYLRGRSASWPHKFPKVLNLLNVRIVELSQEYVIHYMNSVGNLYMEKSALLSFGNGSDFVLLTIHVSGKLAMFHSGDRRWTISKDMPSPYDDVILYDGSLYAVDNTGQTVLVGLDLEMSVISEPVFGGDKKFLVESMGDLLLVDMYLSIEAAEGSASASASASASGSDPGIQEEYFETLAHYMKERTVKFKVFSLDEGEKKWAPLDSLGDRVLFLGDDCTFSASAEDLGICKGNCIIFADNYLVGEESGSLEGCESRDIGIFDLESGSIGPLPKFPEYSKLFWPPPGWISSLALAEVQNHMEEVTL